MEGAGGDGQGVWGYIVPGGYLGQPRRGCEDVLGAGVSPGGCPGVWRNWSKVYTTPGVRGDTLVLGSFPRVWGFSRAPVLGVLRIPEDQGDPC